MAEEEDREVQNPGPGDYGPGPAGSPGLRVCGVVLASLLFQHGNCDSDVEGLLLGESRSEEQVTISDSHTDHVHIQETHSLLTYVSAHRLSHFYNSEGGVDEAALQQLLADNKQAVIGWYRQRRNSLQQVSLKEQLVHRSLQKALNNPQLLFMLLTTCQLTDSPSTHRTEYTAYQATHRRFVPIPLQVTNLGLLEQLSYWRIHTPCSAGYTQTMKKSSAGFFSSDGLLRDVSEVNKMNDCLQTELERVCSLVEQSEREVETLRAEVSALRRCLKDRRPEEEGGGERLEAPEQKNLRLQEAVRSMFSCPLMLSCTLTLHALPLDEGHAPLDQGHAPTPPSKQQREQQPERGRKRRKSCS